MENDFAKYLFKTEPQTAYRWTIESIFIRSGEMIATGRNQISIRVSRKVFNATYFAKFIRASQSFSQCYRSLINFRLLLPWLQKYAFRQICASELC